jgi:hypothetical protein
MNCGVAERKKSDEGMTFLTSPQQRALSQVCEMFLYEGVEGSKKDGPKFMQGLVAKQKARVSRAE